MRARTVGVLIVCTVLSVVLSSRIRFSSNLTDLFPNGPSSKALVRYIRNFGGGDLAVVLVRSQTASETQATVDDLTQRLTRIPSVLRVMDAPPAPKISDPTLAWLYANADGQKELAGALTPEGMRLRLRETRTLLLAPGSGELADLVARDPLRLLSIPWEKSTEIGAGLSAHALEPFSADGGKARLVAIQVRGGAFDSEAATSFVDDAQHALALARERHPTVQVELTGGHAIAVATARMLKHDLAWSGALSFALAALVFWLTFGRLRALVAVLPPLLLGTLWTTGLAALFPGGLSAIAVAFFAVVIGVGVDTGVHLYAALLDGRRRGLSPNDAATFARKESARPTLFAAGAAALAFGCLALSDLPAARELGLLCGAGELLTSVAILIVTPELGAWLERGVPPLPRPSWIRVIDSCTRTRARAGVTLGVLILPIFVLTWTGWPRAGDSIVVQRPRKLAPLATQETIYRLFGGEPGQWIVLTMDRDPDRAQTRADALAQTLEGLKKDGSIAGFDTLTTFAPGAATQRARLRVRDALDLPSLRPQLHAALVDVGFDPLACVRALDAFSQPSNERVSPDANQMGFLLSRHLARDAGQTLVATYIRSRHVAALDSQAQQAILSTDPDAVLTGFGYVEQDLRASLWHDLPRSALGAFLLVLFVVRVALRRAFDVALVFGTIFIELGLVLVAMRLFHVTWHIYDALVLPVLLGITMDESMFLLFAARNKTIDPGSDALRVEGPRVAATALTTAAGFAALLVCDFDGLSDIGAVGALGSFFGLVAALLMIPAGLRLAHRS